MSDASQYDPFDLRGQEDAKAEEKKKTILEARGEAEDLKWIMSNKRGRRYIWKVLGFAGVYRTSFTGNSSTFFNEGMRNVGLRIVQEIHDVCPDHYLTMMKEGKDGKYRSDSEHHSDDASSERNASSGGGTKHKSNSSNGSDTRK